MSREYLTLQEAAVKIGVFASGQELITAEEAILLGADAERLSNYPAREYVVDEDIMPGIPQIINVVVRMFVEEAPQSFDNFSLYATLSNGAEISEV